MRFSLLAAPLLFVSVAASASGFDTGPQGARLLGLGGAATAYAGSIASLSTNPGLLGQWADSLTRISVGGLAQVRRSSFLSGDTRQSTDQDFLIQPGGYLYATHAVTKKVVVGLALNTPYGYHTRYPDNWKGRSVVQESQLNTYFAQPTVGVRLTDNFSIGAGAILATSRYKQRHALGQYDDQSAQATFSGNSSVGVGFNVGVYGRTGDNLAFGISYRSPVKLKVKDGTVNYTGVPSRDALLYPASSTFSTQLNMPSSLAIGLADRITKKLLITFDFALSGWGTLDSLNLNVAASSGAPARREISGRKYEDALAFRVGAEYQATPKLTVLGGVHYDETPVRDEYITPDLPDANRLGASLGFSFQATSRLAVEGAYSFDYGAPRTARASPDAYRVANVSGTYYSLSHSAALGVAVAF